MTKDNAFAISRYLYRFILKREPSEQEVEYWVDYFEKTGSYEKMVEAFQNSEEYKALQEKSRPEILELIKQNCRYIAVNKDNFVFLFDSRDRVILNCLFLNSSYEERDLNNFFELSQKFYPHRRGLFIEAGGNIGTASMQAACHPLVSKVIAFEPSSENYNLFRINLILNHSEDRITIIHAGLSDEETVMDVEICTDNFGDCRMRKAEIEFDKGMYMEELRTVESVPVMTLDTYIKKNDIRLDNIGFFWLDVQGFEPFVLKGASSIIENSIPLVIEFWPYGLKRNKCFEALESILRDHYKSFVIMQEYQSTGKITLYDISELKMQANILTKDNPMLHCDLFLVK